MMVQVIVYYAQPLQITWWQMDLDCLIVPHIIWLSQIVVLILLKKHCYLKTWSLYNNSKSGSKYLTLLFKISHVSDKAQCLQNFPSIILNDNNMPYPGQCYSLDQQCKLIFGPQSEFCYTVSLFLVFILFLLSKISND
jgi:hypothetical protein